MVGINVADTCGLIFLVLLQELDNVLRIEKIICAIGIIFRHDCGRNFTPPLMWVKGIRVLPTFAPLAMPSRCILPFKFSIHLRLVQIGLPFVSFSEPPLQIFIVETIGVVVGDYCFHVSLSELFAICLACSNRFLTESLLIPRFDSTRLQKMFSVN